MTRSARVTGSEKLCPIRFRDRHYKMNADTIVHPKLLHYGPITHNLDAMIEWYRKVLGMTINHRSARPPGATGGPPFTGFAFISNDKINHRIVFLEMPGVGANGGGRDRCSMSRSSARRSTTSWAPTLV